jgi:NAD(P)-dependent dehydrogenase (short-subunit alcohol dehydrogenase family)
MASAGARVVMGDVDVTGGEATAAAAFRQGGEAVFIPCDVSVVEQVDRLVQAAVQTYGRLDGAFNNAGLEGDHTSTVDCGEANWDRTLEVKPEGRVAVHAR